VWWVLTCTAVSASRGHVQLQRSEPTCFLLHWQQHMQATVGVVDASSQAGEMVLCNVISGLQM